MSIFTLTFHWRGFVFTLRLGKEKEKVKTATQPSDGFSQKN